ncbi:MAG TPA: DMT family transporter [Acetobacteraceae bacterium]|nr:DMT family transporter [Acetobacteraceae bacterium]
MLLLVLLTLVWGCSVPAMKLGLRDASPVALVAWRYACAGLFFLPMLGKRPPPRALAAMVGVALLGLVAGQLLQILGVQRTSAVVATIVTAIIPLLTVLLGSVRLHQRIRPHHLAGLALAFGGIALATAGAGPQGAGFTSSNLAGVGCLLASALCISGYYVLGAELALRHGVMTTAAWTTVLGALMLAPLALWTAAAGELRPSAVSIGAVAYLGLLVTGFGITIWLTAMRELPVRIAAGSQYLQPLVGIAVSAAIFGTALRSGFYAGTALVLAGVGLGAAPARR